jgi:hypothetical protein
MTRIRNTYLAWLAGLARSLKATMALIVPQPVPGAGAAPVFAAVSASDTLQNNGNSYYHVKNGGASPDTVTVDSVAPCNFGFDHDYVAVIPAGQERLLGPFPVTRFGGVVGVTHSFVTSVTAALVSLS